MLRVLLLDDHEIVRRGLSDLIATTADLAVVGEAATATETLDVVRTTRPDIAVLDVRLPDGNGVEVCRDIRAEFPDTHCLILTSYSDDEALVDAVLAGASGYLLKQIRTTEILDAIRTVGAGGSLLDPRAVTKARARLQEGAANDDRLAHLTKQERRLLALLANGLSNRQIAAEMFLAEKTVKNYVSSLLAKMGMTRRTEAAVFAARLDERRTTERRRDGGT